MALRDVGDLVPQHARKLGHVGRLLNEAAVHVDVSTGYREGVDLALVHDIEAPCEAPVVGDPGDGVAEHIDVA